MSDTRTPLQIARLASRLEQTPPPFKFNLEATKEGLIQSISSHLKLTLARDPYAASLRDWWYCACMAVRDRVLDRYLQTMSVHHELNVRRVYYFSMEYLMGRLLNDSLRSTLLLEPLQLALKELAQEYPESLGKLVHDTPESLYAALCNEEVDMGLGNGGLGRLASCFLDSLATLQYPAIGYGIHYEFGLFAQEFVDCCQVEHPDNWLKFGNPWQILRAEYSVEVKLYGRVEEAYDEYGRAYLKWVDTKSLVGLPWDVPIVGYGCHTVNFLRLWESRASTEFNFQIFNRGGYIDAVQEKMMGETVSKVLYPNDKTENGKELRLVQQYFFVACSLADILHRHKRNNPDLTNFTEKIAIQLNDTHPAIAIAELMRILIDQEHFLWEDAWSICVRSFGYTNHTLLPEALECWSVPLLSHVLPRHLQIIFEINRRFLAGDVELYWPGDDSKKMDMSLIQETNPKMVRMANLAIVGSHSVNGVAALHTQLLKDDLFPGFCALYPERFNNKTNGITPRRWLGTTNPRLAKLITGMIGDNWITDLSALEQLEPYASNVEFQQQFREVKQANKNDLAVVIKELCGITIDSNALFDVQIKRLHEYKRQHLNLLHILTLYRRLLDNPNLDIIPRVFIFAAKAAPGYELAKTMIRAINCVAAKINNDSRIGGKIKIAFLPNYGVTLAEKIIPAANLSEQISTAGKEASGTGNMKLALNGALTIGTMDGANVEICEAVGAENMFIFGLNVAEVKDLFARGYNPRAIYHKSEELRNLLGWLNSDYFTPQDSGALSSITYSLLDGGDPFLVLADYAAYLEAQSKVDVLWRNPSEWDRKAILNTARMGPFSSDRTILEYARDIWHVEPVVIPHGYTNADMSF
jgi:glycogen phosphorylase